MSGSIGLDFGTSNTVVAVWHTTRGQSGEGIPYFVPGYGRLSKSGDAEIPVIPSLIHYAQENR